MIAAFIDESGNDGQSSVFAMATVLLSQSSSYYFGNDWQNMLANFGVSEFHASDYHGGRGDFRGWTADQRNELQTAIVELLQKWQVKHSAALVANNDYRRSFVDTGFNRTIRPTISKWKKPYLIAFQHTVLDLRECTDHQPKGCYIVPVFDNCKEFMSQARQYYDQRNADGKLGGMHVPDTRQEYAQIQAADFFAWEYRVFAERCVATGQRSPGPVLEALREHSFGVKLWSFDFLEHLRMRVEAVNGGIDPDTMTMPETAAVNPQ
jgi:hypothetical protein